MSPHWTAMPIPEDVTRKALATIAGTHHGCWLWPAHTDRRYGYGVIYHAGTRWLAHRVVYDSLVGPIPHGLELDHLCNNPACVNPDHLEPVTNAVNRLRGRERRHTTTVLKEDTP